MTADEWKVLITLIIGIVTILGWAYTAWTQRELKLDIDAINRTYELKDRELQKYRDRAVKIFEFTALGNEIIIKYDKILYLLYKSEPDMASNVLAVRDEIEQLRDEFFICWQHGDVVWFFNKYLFGQEGYEAYEDYTILYQNVNLATITKTIERLDKANQDEIEDLIKELKLIRDWLQNLINKTTEIYLLKEEEFSQA